VADPRDFELEEAVPASDFELFDSKRVVEPSDDLKEAFIALKSVTTGAGVDEIRSQLEGFPIAPLEGESRANALGTSDQKTRVALIDQVQQAGDSEEIRRLVLQAELEKEDIQSTLAPEVYDVTTMAPGALWDRNNRQLAARRQSLAKILDKAYQEAEVSVGSVIWDVLDLVLSAPLDGLTLGGFSRVEKAQEIRDLIADTTISDEEFQARAGDALREMADAGWLTQDNFLFLTGGIANIAEGGQGFSSFLEQAGGVADLVGGVGLASRLLRGAKNSTALVGILSGSGDAENVLRAAAKNPDSVESISGGVARQTSPSILRHPENGGVEFDWVAPGAKIANELATENSFLNFIQDLAWSKNVNIDKLQEATPALMEKLADSVLKKQRTSLLDILPIQTDKSGNIFGILRFGTTKGHPYNNLQKAEQRAKELDGRVRTIIVGGEEKFVVDVQRNLSGAGLVDPLNLNEISDNLLRAFSSTFLSVPNRLRELAVRGESVGSIVAEKARSVFKEALKGVKKEEVEGVEAIFYEMRDGAKFAESRQALSLPEFRSEWYNRFETTPSQKTENLYLTIQEMNDAVYFLIADPVFKEYVDRGIEMLSLRFVRKTREVDNVSVPVQKVNREELPPGTLVHNPISGVDEAIENVTKKDQVFSVPGGYAIQGKRAKYISVESPSLRRVYHSDVLGYNPGGPRVYSTVNHYVKQETEILFTDGTRAKGTPKTVMGTFSRQQAVAAVDEMNELFKGLGNLVGGSFAKMRKANAIDAIAALRSTPLAEDLVVRLTKWNKNIGSIDDLVDFLRKQEIDPTKPFGVAGKDDLLALPDEAGELSFGLGRSSTFEDGFVHSLNSPRNGPRRDEPLLAYGGDFAETVSPIRTMQNDFLKAVHQRSFQAFNLQAVNAWLKGAEKHIQNLVDIQGLRPSARMARADFGPNPSPDARKYIDARSAIQRTLGARNESDMKWEKIVQRVAEFVFDKGFERIARVINNSDFIKSPFQWLRAMVFHARLGMLDPAQLIVQSSQSFNIMAISGRPFEWLQNSAMHIPLRLSLLTDDPAKINEVARRVAPFIGMQPEEFVSFRQWVVDSGRLNVGSEVIEVNATSLNLAKSMVGRAASAGRIFFDEGEKFPRSVSLATAWKEYKRKFPTSDPFSEHGLNWISGRSDTLTNGMTRASSAPWQKGPLSVPLQFMTYSARMMEALFVGGGNVLTRNERIRLGLAQVAFWGASGLGIRHFTDQYFLNQGIELDDTQYTLVSYGVLDALLQASTGTQAVFGGRIAFAEGFTQLVQDMHEKTLFEVIGGPGGQLVGDVGQSVMEGFVNMVNGRFSLADNDLTKFLRNFTTGNKAYNAWMMFTVGDYLSRNEDVILSGVTDTDALLHILGGQLRDANIAFSRLELMKGQDEFLKKHGQRIKVMMNEARKATAEERWDDVDELSGQISMAIGILPVWQREKVINFLRPDFDSLGVDMFNKAVIDRRGSWLSGFKEEEDR